MKRAQELLSITLAATLGMTLLLSGCLGTDSGNGANPTIGPVPLPHYSLLDLTFGLKGQVLEKAGGAQMSLSAGYSGGFGLLSDKKIVLLSTVSTSLDSVGIQTVRLLPDGRRDPSFYEGKGHLLDTGGDLCFQLFKITVDSLDRVTGVATGCPNGLGTKGAYVFRMTSNGEWDPTFNRTGYRYLNGIRLTGVLIDSAGRILASGSSGDDWILLRTHWDGTLDTDFGLNGLAQGSISGTTSNQLNAIVEQSTGHYSVVGKTELPQWGEVAMAVKTDSSGQPDNSFGLQGYSLFGQSTEYRFRNAHDVSISEAGALMIAGEGYSNSTGIHYYARGVPVSVKNPDGTTIVDGHCRKNPNRHEIFVADEIHEISAKHFRNLKSKPTADAMGFPQGNQYDDLIGGWTQFWNDIFKLKIPLDPNLIKALVASESGFDLKAKAESKVGIARL